MFTSFDGLIEKTLGVVGRKEGVIVLKVWIAFDSFDSSPTYVDHGMELEVVGQRIMWGKLMNAGQICVAPDYVLCPADIAV